MTSSAWVPIEPVLPRMSTRMRLLTRLLCRRDGAEAASTAGQGQHGGHADAVVVPPRSEAARPAAATGRRRTRCSAVFVLDPRLEASSGPRRLQFLCDSLRHLRDELDGRLFVTRGRPEERIPAVVNEIGASAVHISEDFTPFGRRRDEAVRDALGDVPLHATGSPYLVSPGRVTKDDGTPYKVFSPFFDRWRDVGWRAPAGSSAESARWVDPADLRGRRGHPRSRRRPRHRGR